MSLMALISTVFLALSLLCTVWVAWDIKKHPQPMTIMNVVWPITVIYSGPIGLIFYYYIGRRAHQEKPMWQSTVASTSHCGAGCALGDIIGIPIVVALGVDHCRHPLVC